MRFTAYLGACAALVAATQAADIGAVTEVPVALDAHAEAAADTGVEAESGIYLAIDADAAAETDAYLAASIEAAAQARAYVDHIEELLA